MTIRTETAPHARAGMLGWLRVFLLGLVALACFAAAAQDFPTREVKIVVPQAAGGASDALARIVASSLAERWHQSVIVENKVGANGNIGTEYVARSKPDGYTLLLTYVGTHATSPALYSNLGWDPVRAFGGVADVAVVPFVMVVNSKVPAHNLQELFALGKKQELRFASPGAGSLNHLLGERFSRAAGIQMLHVPYKGISQAMTDLIAGRVDVTFSSMESVLPHVQAGTLRAIAVTGADRSEKMPDLPTMMGQGLKDFDVTPWFGFVAPAGLPPALIARLNHDINEVVSTPDVQARFKAVGAVPVAMAPAEFDALIKRDVGAWRQVIQATGIHLD
jgi:tripartite-type tricarboxylate transporter receptor subunit TctC